MELDNECRSCLFNSQIKKVEREQSDKTKLGKFKREVKELCESAPGDCCAHVLMRGIDLLHRRIFGCGIDYSREKSLFNKLLLETEQEVYFRAVNSSDPLEEALKFASASNYIDFARLSGLNEDSIKAVFAAAERSRIDKITLANFKNKLKDAETLCYLHDNCGEIVLDKILIRVIKELYPQISITSVVRGKPIINDATRYDAKEVKLDEFSEIVDNGSDVAGTYLKEASAEVIRLLRESSVILSKGLGNLETLYGEGYQIFYAFTCKCEHISQRFDIPLWSTAFIEERK